MYDDYFVKGNMEQVVNFKFNWHTLYFGNQLSSSFRFNIIMKFVAYLRMEYHEDKIRFNKLRRLRHLIRSMIPIRKVYQENIYDRRRSKTCADEAMV